MPSTTIVPPIHISILVQLAFRNAKVSEKAAPILILIMLFPLLVEPRSSFRVKYDPAYDLQQPACIRDLFLPLRKGTVQPKTSPALRIASRSEEHTSELQSLLRISYAVICLK